MQSDGGRTTRRQHVAGRTLRTTARGCRRGVPGETLTANVEKNGDGFRAVVIPPERAGAVALAGVELVPA